MSELVGVMLVEASFSAFQAAADKSLPPSPVLVILLYDGQSVVWIAGTTLGHAESQVISTEGRCKFIPEFAVPVGVEPSSVAIDTAIAQAYDVFCLQYDIWRRESHLEWLPTLPMSLGIKPGERGGTWSFRVAPPAPKATSPKGQAPSGGKQKQHGKSRSDRAAGKAGAKGRSKLG